MIRNIRFIWLLIRLKLSHMMVFRLSFFGAFLTDGMLFITQLVTFQIIFSQVETLGTWGQGEMLIFIGTFSMINGISMVICFFGVVEIPNKITSGDLDLYLTKPGSPLLRLTFENVNPGSAPLLILSGLIIAYGVQVAGVELSAALILGYSVLVLLMTLLFYDVELIIRILPFFFLGTSNMQNIEANLLELNFRVPGIIYEGLFKVIFFFIVPYGIMATVPTQFITRSLTTGWLLQALGVVVFFTGFALWFWRFGLRHYKSASS